MRVLLDTCAVSELARPKGHEILVNLPMFFIGRHRTVQVTGLMRRIAEPIATVGMTGTPIESLRIALGQQARRDCRLLEYLPRFARSPLCHAYLTNLAQGFGSACQVGIAKLRGVDRRIVREHLVGGSIHGIEPADRT